MRFGHKLLAVVLVAIGLGVSARWTLWAQERVAPPGQVPIEGEAAVQVVGSAQDALIRPYDFPFAEPIALVDACSTMGRSLGFAVALDQAALDRQNVTDDQAVKLDLKGVRLKVGLKLLLDPLHLTFRVEPEDNLLIITDAEGSEDPAKLALVEIKAIHKEIHDLQDAVDDLRDLVEEELGFEPEEQPHRTTIVAHPSPRRPNPLPRTSSPRNRR